MKIKAIALTFAAFTSIAFGDVVKVDATSLTMIKKLIMEGKTLKDEGEILGPNHFIVIPNTATVSEKETCTVWEVAFLRRSTNVWEPALVGRGVNNKDQIVKIAENLNADFGLCSGSAMIKDQKVWLYATAPLASADEPLSWTLTCTWGNGSEPNKTGADKTVLNRTESGTGTTPTDPVDPNPNPTGTVVKVDQANLTTIKQLIAAGKKVNYEGMAAKPNQFLAVATAEGKCFLCEIGFIRSTTFPNTWEPALVGLLDGKQVVLKATGDVQSGDSNGKNYYSGSLMINNEKVWLYASAPSSTASDVMTWTVASTWGQGSAPNNSGSSTTTVNETTAAGGNPNPNPVKPSITGLAKIGNSMVIKATWNADAKTHVVQHSTNLQTWTTVSTSNPTKVGGSEIHPVIQLTVPVSGTRGFWRIIETR